MRGCRIACAWALLSAGCERVAGEPGLLLPPLALASVGPSPVVPGTVLVIRGSGFVPVEVVSYEVRLEGTLSGAPLTVSAVPVRVADDLLELPVEGALGDALLGADAELAGTLEVVRRPLTADLPESARRDLTLAIRTALAPEALDLAPLVAYPGDPMTVTLAGLLQPSEGTTWARLDGELTTEVPPAKVEVADVWVALTPVAPDRRDQARFTLEPEILGVRPGAFSGTLQLTNVDREGVELDAPPLALASLALQAPWLSAVSPLEVSRGQWLTALGRGFVAAGEEGAESTLLVLEGVFEPERGDPVTLAGPSALTLFPDALAGNTELRVVVRVDYDLEGLPFGLGATPGVLRGQARPMVLWASDFVQGDPRPLTLRIRAPRQVVHLKLLASFDQALARFGLLTERQAILARVMAVCLRDYEGINVEFRFERPDDFAEYQLVEIGSDDPNGLGLFGLDNSAGKDVGNRRFDDVIGGFNAETRDGGYAAFGGIFVAEFLNFSPTLSNRTNVSERFDQIFGPFVPELGGAPAEPGEAAAGGPRSEALEEAVRVLGNLIGSTITHEVGHTLGLAAVEGQFHHPGDNPGWLMDGGIYRPFEERAELDGEGPGVFGEVDAPYLAEVLPLDP